MSVFYMRSYHMNREDKENLDKLSIDSAKKTREKGRIERWRRRLKGERESCNYEKRRPLKGKPKTV